MRALLADFKKFISQGNVIDLAVAVVIGTAFTAVVNSLVNNVVMPIVGILFGEPSFDDLTLTVNDSVIKYGSFLTALVTFLLIALAVFLIVKAYEKLQSRRKTTADTDEEEELGVAEELLKEIRDILKDERSDSSAPPAPPLA
jgi:large conductance mechanosensitive channel